MRGLGAKIFAVLGIVALGACASRGAIVETAADAPAAAVEPILVASSRTPENGPELFGSGAAEELSYARISVAVPPDRAPGSLQFPNPLNPDPRREFSVRAAERIADQSAFLDTLNLALESSPAGSREVFVFVHGFNVNFAEGIYRQAQMRHDFAPPGVSLSYAWPSAGSVRAYGRDRESALVARDGLEDLLGLLARSRADRVVVLAHSMGAFVVMEAVRQAAIRGERSAFAKVKAIVLVAPDLDIEVFRRQVEEVDGLGLSFYVFTSSRDRALWVSAFLRGGGNVRLGSIPDTAALGDLAVPVTVIDLSYVSAERDALNHFVVATSPATIALFRGLGAYGLNILREDETNSNAIDAGVGVVRDVRDIILLPFPRPARG